MASGGNLEAMGCMAVIIFVFFAFLAFCIGGSEGDRFARESMQDEAVRAGHAEYYLDKDNNRQWRWKECK